MWDIMLDKDIEKKKADAILAEAIKAEGGKTPPKKKLREEVINTPSDISFETINEAIRVDYSNSDVSINLRLITGNGVREYQKVPYMNDQVIKEVKEDKRFLSIELKRLVEDFDFKAKELLEKAGYNLKR